MKQYRVAAIYFLTIGLLISGCGPGQLLGPTLTSTPTNTSTPTLTPMPTNTATPTPTITPSITPTPMIPKPGHWKGTTTNPSVSFDLTTDLMIESLKIDNIRLTSNVTCSLELSMGSIFKGELYVDLSFVSGIEEYISGKFDSPTTVTGPYKFRVCSNTIASSDIVGTWSAEWQKP